MSSLVVVAHSDRDSLTHGAARAAFDAIRSAGGDVEFADLAAEGFDPRLAEADLDLYRGKAGAPAEILAEQERIDRADHMILVFPMYWWSMPALLKGWIDRVFVGGWAYDPTPGAVRFGMLDRLTIHLVIVAGDDADSFERHEIPQAVRTQIERGIIEYSGATHGSTSYLYESDTKDRDLLAAEVLGLGEMIARRTAERSSIGAPV